MKSRAAASISPLTGGRKGRGEGIPPVRAPRPTRPGSPTLANVNGSRRGGTSRKRRNTKSSRADRQGSPCAQRTKPETIARARKRVGEPGLEEARRTSFDDLPGAEQAEGHFGTVRSDGYEENDRSPPFNFVRFTKETNRNKPSKRWFVSGFGGS